MYKIEITAASLEELSDKTLALGGRLAMAFARAPAAAVEAPAPVAKPVAKPATDPWPIEDSGLAGLPPLPVAEEPLAEKPAAERVPDYATEIAPAVLAYVKVKGKPAAGALLAEYNATRASEIDQSKWAELLARINREIVA